jgi:hypothetical protein
LPDASNQGPGLVYINKLPIAPDSHTFLKEKKQSNKEETAAELQQQQQHE